MKYPKAYKTYRKKRATRTEKPIQLMYGQSVPAGIYDVQKTGGNQRIAKVMRMVDAGIILASTAAISPNTLSFTLASLPQYSELVSLYDQYRVDKVEVWFKSQQHAGQATGSGGASAGWIAIAVDFDDNVTPSTVAQILAYDNAVIVEPQEDYYITFVPHIARATQVSGGGYSGASNDKNGWLDTVSSSILHYGVKWVINTSGNVNNPSWHVCYKIHMSFKNVK